MFYPQLQREAIDRFSPENQERLLSGHAVHDNYERASGETISAFLQLDTETKQVMIVPTEMIGRNLDLLQREYNVMSYRYNRANDQRFDLIPFAGCGLIHNSDLHRSDFSLNYGIQAKYHLNDRLHLTAEASGLTTFQQFDGHGASDKLGDHKFDVSLGHAVNLGKVGFRKSKSQPIAYKVLDTTNTYKSLKSDNQDKQESEHQKTISWSGSSTKHQPVNNYSGLNSLRARLAEAGQTTNNNANTQTYSSLSAVCHCGNNASCLCSDCSGKCASDGNCGQQHTKKRAQNRLSSTGQTH